MDLAAVAALLKDTFSEWNEDRAPRLAAALAYYTIFSLAPLLIIVIAVAGLAFGRQAVQGEIVGQIRGLVGESGATVIQAMIQSTAEPKSGILATVIGIVTLLLGAAGVFGQLRDALNTIWEVERKSGPGGIRGVIKAIQDNLLSFSMVLGVGFLLLASLVISAALAALRTFALGLAPGLAPGLEVANAIVSFGVITVLFAMIYKVLPDVKIAWRDVWLGAAVTSLLFTIGKFLIGLYLGKSSVASAYGVAGSFVIILIWIDYSAQIFFLGAEFIQVYTRKYGAGYMATENAMPVTEKAHAEQR